MAARVPKSLIAEQQAVEAEIREAFKGVTREGGVSWSESDVMDAYGSEEERQEARAKDTDRNWTELADSKWDCGPGMGGFSFLDPIGYRYYLAAAMVRCIHDGDDAYSNISLDGTLTFDKGPLGEYRSSQWSLLNPRQRRAVARFLRFMSQWRDPKHAEFKDRGWQAAYESYWKKVE